MAKVLIGALREGKSVTCRSDPEVIDRRLPSGGIGFVVAYGVSGLITGAGVGLLLSEYAMISVAVLYGLVAGAYVILLYVLARLGYVPIMGHELYDPFAS